MGSRADFRVPPPPAVDLRVGELFPGGRWKHRTSSSSTTSTLIVEIAATTKKSMAVPEQALHEAMVERIARGRMSVERSAKSTLSKQQPEYWNA